LVRRGSCTRPRLIALSIAPLRLVAPSLV
jgi:hypothetical protein